MNKEELEKEVLTLEKQIEASETVSESYQAELETAQRRLKDINKPKLTPLQFDLINDAIEAGISDFDFSDEGNYDKEFEIDYDNRIQLSNFDFTNSQELLEVIVEEVQKLFVEAECPDE